MSKWNVIIITSKKSEEFYKKHVCNAIVKTHQLLDKDYFDIDTYNILLKSNNLWNSIGDFKKCLLIQDDGCIVKKGLEKNMQVFNVDYIGAPWIKCKENQELDILCKPHMVGNGGLCLRNIQACQKITESEKMKKQLFNNNLQPIQEDVYFSSRLQEEGYVVASENIAELFSVEQVFNKDALGFHKFWCYNSIDKVKEFLETI
jgi:hypothetical protein